MIFKRIFGTERNKNILQDFLSHLLNKEILELKFENSELVPHHELDGKAVRLDVLATVQTDKGIRLINIELQNVTHPSLIQRAAYYCAQLYAGQLNSGDKYNDLHPTCVIFIMNFRIFPEIDRSVSNYELREEKTGVPLVSGVPPLELKFIELPKVLEKVDTMADTDLAWLDRWLLFLAADDDETLERLRMTSKGTELEWALTEIEYAALSKKEKQLYNARVEGERIQRTILHENLAIAKAEGHDRGLAEGLAEGIEVGRVKGRIEGKIEVLMNLIHGKYGSVPKGLQDQVCALSDEQLDQIVALVLESLDLQSFEERLRSLSIS